MRKALVAPVIVGLVAIGVVVYGYLSPNHARPLTKTSEEDGPAVTFVLKGIVSDGSRAPAVSSSDMTVTVGDYFVVDKPDAGWTHVIGSSPAPRTHPTAVLWLFNRTTDAAFRFHVFKSEDAEPWVKMTEMSEPLRQAGFIVRRLTEPGDDLAAIAFERNPDEEVTGAKLQGAIAVGRVSGKPELSFYVVGLWDQTKKVGPEMTAALLKAVKTVRAVPPSQ